MAIGERIRFIRNLRGMTQKYLGTIVGLPEKTADVRMAQYEAGSRTPKDDLINKLAAALGVSTSALKVPDIDTDMGLIHTLFALEDLYGLTVETRDDEVLFYIDSRKGSGARFLHRVAFTWAERAEKYRAGEISKEEYDRWRYNYPEYDDSGIWQKMPSQELSDALIKSLRKK